MKKKTIKPEELAADVTKDIKEELFHDVEYTKTKSKLTKVFKSMKETSKDDEDFCEESGLHAIYELIEDHIDHYGADPDTIRMSKDKVTGIIERYVLPHQDDYN